jgi:hypothetical protein
MVGVVRTRHLLTHFALILREFGVRCWLRCIWRTFMSQRSVTFLECVETFEPLTQPPR